MILCPGNADCVLQVASVAEKADAYKGKHASPAYLAASVLKYRFPLVVCHAYITRAHLGWLHRLAVLQVAQRSLLCFLPVAHVKHRQCDTSSSFLGCRMTAEDVRQEVPVSKMVCVVQ